MLIATSGGATVSAMVCMSAVAATSAENTAYRKKKTCRNDSY